MFARTFLIDLAQRAIVTGAQAFLISLTVASAGEAAILAAAAAGRKVPKGQTRRDRRTRRGPTSSRR